MLTKNQKRKAAKRAASARKAGEKSTRSVSFGGTEVVDLDSESERRVKRGVKKQKVAAHQYIANEKRKAAEQNARAGAIKLAKRVADEAAADADAERATKRRKPSAADFETRDAARAAGVDLTYVRGMGRALAQDGPSLDVLLAQYNLAHADAQTSRSKLRAALHVIRRGESANKAEDSATKSVAPAARPAMTSTQFLAKVNVVSAPAGNAGSASADGAAATVPALAPAITYAVRGHAQPRSGEVLISGYEAVALIRFDNESDGAFRVRLVNHAIGSSTRQRTSPKNNNCLYESSPYAVHFARRGQRGQPGEVEAPEG